MIEELTLAKWAQVREGLLATIEKFTDAELVYRPSPNGYAVGETILHIAHEEDIEINHALTRSPSELPEAYDVRDFPDKASVIAVLDEVHGRALSYLRLLSDSDLEAQIETPWTQVVRPVDMLWHVIEHEIHHRGELSLILGLLGREGLDA